MTADRSLDTPAPLDVAHAFVSNLIAGDRIDQFGSIDRPELQASVPFDWIGRHVGIESEVFRSDDDNVVYVPVRTFPQMVGAEPIAWVWMRASETEQRWVVEHLGLQRPGDARPLG